MRIELEITRTHFSWEGLGIYIGLCTGDGAEVGERAVWCKRSAPGSRSFRLWDIRGTIGRAERPRTLAEVLAG